MTDETITKDWEHEFWQMVEEKGVGSDVRFAQACRDFIKEHLTLAEKQAYEKGYQFAKQQQDQKITILMQDIKKAEKAGEEKMKEKIKGILLIKISQENKFLFEFNKTDISKHKWHNAKKGAFHEILDSLKQSHEREKCFCHCHDNCSGHNQCLKTPGKNILCACLTKYCSHCIANVRESQEREEK